MNTMNTPETSLVKEERGSVLFNSYSARVKDIAFDRVDRALVALYSGTVQVWDWRHWSLLAELQHSTGPCRAVAAHPSLALLASAGDDNTIKLWHSETFECMATITAHLDYIRHLVFHPTRPWLMSCGDDMTIRVWHVNALSLELLATLTHHSHYVMDIALHPTSSDELVSVSLDGHMAVWDLTTFTLVRSVPLAPAGLGSVAFNRAGNELIVAGDRGLLLKVHRASFRATPLAGHSNDVHHAQYFDERTILSAGADGTVRVWRESDKGTDGTQQAFTPRRGRVWKVLCHPTEPGLCAAALDDGVQFFTVTLEPLALRPFTPVTNTTVTTASAPLPSQGKRGWFWAGLLLLCWLCIIVGIALNTPDVTMAWYWFMFMFMGVAVLALLATIGCAILGTAAYHAVMERRRKVSSFKSIV
jgi:WD40 repeat protein/uncharacterized integral membrane protein